MPVFDEQADGPCISRKFLVLLHVKYIAVSYRISAFDIQFQLESRHKIRLNIESRRFLRSYVLRVASVQSPPFKFACYYTVPILSVESSNSTKY